MLQTVDNSRLQGPCCGSCCRLFLTVVRTSTEGHGYRDAGGSPAMTRPHIWVTELHRLVLALRAMRARVQVAVPRYDKAAHGGRGTRAPEHTWPTVKGPLDLILFEGWMLGFSPVRP